MMNDQRNGIIRDHCCYSLPYSEHPHFTARACTQHPPVEVVGDLWLFVVKWGNRYFWYFTDSLTNYVGHCVTLLPHPPLHPSRMLTMLVPQHWPTMPAFWSESCVNKPKPYDLPTKARQIDFAVRRAAGIMRDLGIMHEPDKDWTGCWKWKAR